MMKMILTILLLIPSLAMAKLIEPEVINNSKAQEVKLGKDAQQALEKFDKQLKILEPRHYLDPVIGLFEGFPNELPQAISEDFNGDGIKDIIIMGLSEQLKSTVIKAVLLVSSKTKYIAIPLDQWNSGLPRGVLLEDAYKRLHNVEMYLGLAEKREVLNTNVPLGQAAFKIEVYLKNTTLYYLKGTAIVKPLRRHSNN